MKNPTSFSVKDQQLWLSPDRAVYWEEQQALIVSDMHFGKTGHFRKAGIPVPQAVFKEDLHRLVQQLQYFQPRQLIIVGDLFHSDANKELELFQKWRDDLADLHIELIKGNHDILSEKWYSAMNISTHKETLKIQNFCFQHDLGKCESPQDSGYLVSGHMHPGIQITGVGKQVLKFPCFYFTDTHCILPAFSKFTGSVSIKMKADDVAFAIVNNSIVRVN